MMSQFSEVEVLTPMAPAQSVPIDPAQDAVGRVGSAKNQSDQTVFSKLLRILTFHNMIIFHHISSYFIIFPHFHDYSSGHSSALFSRHVAAAAAQDVFEVAFDSRMKVDAV